MTDLKMDGCPKSGRRFERIARRNAMAEQAPPAI